MKSRLVILPLLSTLVLGACANMSETQRNTAIGAGIGNVVDKLRRGETGAIADTLRNGFVVDGRAFDELDKLARSRGLEVSIQSGTLQAIEYKGAINRQAYKLNSATGLVGSPSVDPKKIMKCRTLLIPDMVPGVKVVLDAAFTTGTYRILRATYTGSLYGPDFYCQIEGKAI